MLEKGGKQVHNPNMDAKVKQREAKLFVSCRYRWNHHFRWLVGVQK